MNITKRGVYLLLLIMTIALVLTAQALATDILAMVEIPVQKLLTGDRPPSDTEFTFVLEPDAPEYPMPFGGASLTLSGEGTGVFGTITYTSPGEYTYTVRETDGGEPDYTYDDSVYSVKVLVRNGGEPTVFIERDGSTAKAYAAVFTNEYNNREPTVSPQTNDSGGIVTYALLTVISIPALAAPIMQKVRRSKK